MTECDEILVAMNNLPTEKTNTIATNVLSTASINCHSKKVRDCYILHKVLSVTIIRLIITVICYHYVKQEGIV